MALTTNKYNTREPDMIYLCKPDSKIHIVLNGVHTDDVSLEIHARDWWSLRFRVDRFINVDGELVESNGYEYLHNHMELFLPQLGYFQMQEPEIINEGQDEYKSVIAYSCDRELVDKDYYGLKVNTGEVDSLEYLATDNIDETTGIAKQYVTIYNPNNPELSLLDVLFKKAPNWEVRREDIDPILWTRKIQIDEDNVNIWGLLNSTVGPKGNCIFLYDIMNRRVKAYAKETLNSRQFDTNIFIGLRNLAKTINITVDEDSISTRFNVAGDEELNITAVNFGDRRIWNLDWYLTNNYMDDELIEKIQAWKTWLDNNRSTYGNLSRQIADVQAKIDELNLKVPNDADYWKQWDSMTEDLLRANLEMYQGLITALQESVDEDPQFDDDGNYIPWIDGEGNVDHARYLALLKESANGYGGYYSYIEYNEYVIPNIEIAISNIGVTADQKHDYVIDYETNWELYGIEELNGRLSDYESRLNSLKNYAKSWSELTPEEKASYMNSEEQYNTMGRSEYVRIYNAIGYGDNPSEGTIMYRLNELKAELASLENDMADLRAEQKILIDTASMDYEDWDFTEDEKLIINKLMIDTDYENTNIITTSLDTTSTIVDREFELLDDALDHLSEASQPQYRFTCSLENLYELEEFADWIPDLELLNFVRLGIRDDYMVKLRVMGIIFNPCEKMPDLELEFSNFIISRMGRSDMEDVLNNASNSGSKNSITLGSTTKTDESFVNMLLQQMTRSNLFSNAVTNIAGTVGTTDDVAVKNIITEYMGAYQIDVQKITGDEGNFNRLFTTYLGAELVATKVLDADDATIRRLSAELMDVTTINVEKIVGDTGQFNQFFVDHLEVEEVFGDNAQFNTLVSNIVDTSSLQADVANINNIMAGNVGAGSVTTFVMTADNVVINQEAVRSLIASQISVADLQAGNIVLTDAMQILSDNGKMIMNGRALQILGEDEEGNPYVGIQLGYDTSSTPSLILRNADGQLLLTPTGITEKAIADELIVNDMIKKNTIQKEKLGFNVMEVGDAVQITQIYDGDTKFGVKYTQFQNEIERRLGSIESGTSSISVSGQQVFKQVEGSITPSAITIEAQMYNCTLTNWYLDGVVNTAYAVGNTFVLPASYMQGRDFATVKAEGSTGVYDEISIVRVVDGSAAITVVINSNKGTIFPPESDITQTTLSCAVFQGSTQITPNSYEWFKYTGNDYVSTGQTTSSITVSTTTSAKYKCRVDV